MELPTAGTALVIQDTCNPREGLIEALEWAERTCPGQKPTLVVPEKRALENAGIDELELTVHVDVKKVNADGYYGRPPIIISFLPNDPFEYGICQDAPHCVIPLAAMGSPNNFVAQRVLGEVLPAWLPWIAGTEPELIGSGTRAWSLSDFPASLAEAEWPELKLIHSRVAGYRGSINASSLNKRDIRNALEQTVNRRGAKIPWPELERWAWAQGWSGHAIKELHVMSAKYVTKEH